MQSTFKSGQLKQSCLDVTAPITISTGVEYLPDEWPELLECLKERYRHCKKKKLSADNEDWSEWSGIFNRHCNKKDAGNGYGNFSRLIKIWATYTRLLALHKLLSETTTIAGKSGRDAINKIISDNLEMLSGQKKEFEGSLS